MSRKTVGERATEAMWRALPPLKGVQGPELVRRAVYRSAYLRGYLAGWRASQRTKRGAVT